MEQEGTGRYPSLTSLPPLSHAFAKPNFCLLVLHNLLSLFRTLPYQHIPLLYYNPDDFPLSFCVAILTTFNHQSIGHPAREFAEANPTLDKPNPGRKVTISYLKLTTYHLMALLGLQMPL